MHLRYSFPPVSILALAGLFLLTGAVAAAERACSGQAADACESDSQCTWVSAHARKDGVAVNGYCRSKPAKRRQVSQAKD